MGNIERSVSFITEQGPHPLRTLLWETLTAAKVEKDYVPDRDRQKAVFDRIEWGSFTDDVLREGKEGKQVRGKIFEMFIQADPEFGDRSPLEKELLDLSHNPDKFGLGKELGYHRNPDMAFLLLHKDDGVEIIGVGESKLGLLNERSFKQLSETGFEAGVDALIDVVNNLPDPEKHGLVEVAKARPLRKASEFSQLLVVPANRKIEWKSTLINRREFTQEGRDTFYAMLSDETQVRTARAAFSTGEVSAIASMVTLNE